MENKTAHELQDQLFEMLSDNVPEEMKVALDQFAHAMIFGTLDDVMHLLDMMELDDARKLEFAKLTEKGENQRFGFEVALKRIRKHLLTAMNAELDAMKEFNDEYECRRRDNSSSHSDGDFA
jgi:hypothetical protein